MAVDALACYDRAAFRAVRAVIRTYSTSFSLAVRFLSPRVRDDICALYAVVRIADELVDGAAASPTELIDAYEAHIRHAHIHRVDTDLISHAFGITARRCGIDDEHLRAFFAAMRSDIDPIQHTEESLNDYVYGSAEVVGLMCLAIFFADRPRPANYVELEHAARRLGHAFQMINFLRDVGADTALGRHYLVSPLTDAAKNTYIARIRDDLDTARQALPFLPQGARYGVRAAIGVYEELTDMIENCPANELSTQRLSVPPWRKALVTAREYLRRTHP